MNEQATRYPKLPSKIMGAGGMIKIVRQAELTYEGKACWGLWDESTRTITIDSGATPEHARRVFYHEVAHAMLADSGIENLFDDNTVEMLCDMIATGRMRERFG